MGDKECVTDVYGPADEALKGKITDVEAGLKADKEKKVKDYFAEMVKASGVEWVTYEDVGVAVTLTASLKSLKAKVKEYVEKVAADVACINGMENAPEIMAEYKLCGSLAVAINSVSQRKDRIAREEAERKQRLEAQLRAQEAEKAVLDVAEEELSAPQVMGTEPPVMDEQETEDSQKESTEQVMNAKFAFMGRTFQCRGTLTQLRELKSFVNDKVDEIQKYICRSLSSFKRPPSMSMTGVCSCLPLLTAKISFSGVLDMLALFVLSTQQTSMTGLSTALQSWTPLCKPAKSRVLLMSAETCWLLGWHRELLILQQILSPKI